MILFTCHKTLNIQVPIMYSVMARAHSLGSVVDALTHVGFLIILNFELLTKLFNFCFRYFF
ncbi:hypothetical protein Hdeb2414_s0010g00334601 [Helianthus debilis subsp. tardiflorus]